MIGDDNVYDSDDNVYDSDDNVYDSDYDVYDSDYDVCKRFCQTKEKNILNFVSTWTCDFVNGGLQTNFN